MTARRTVAALLLVVAVALVALAALTPLRSAEIAELDAEALRLAELWKDDQSNGDLATESNEFYERARDLEPPLGPFTALGGALLFAAAGVAAWPGSRSASSTDPEFETA